MAPQSLQQQVVERLQSAAEDAFETSLIDMLYELEHGDVDDLFIDVARNENGDADQIEAANRINKLCETLGVAPKKLIESFIKGRYASEPWFDRAITENDLRYWERRGLTIGEFVTERAIDALPIEKDEDGSSNVSFLAQTPYGCVVEIEGQGSYWMEYPPEDSDDESIIGWSITYKASIKRDN